ncbi:hypothetical protein ACVDFE_29765 [Lentzea chajnantorensis]
MGGLARRAEAVLPQAYRRGRGDTARGHVPAETSTGVVAEQQVPATGPASPVLGDVTPPVTRRPLDEL